MNNTESKKDKEYTLNFSIDGKWLADLCRTRLKEGDYQHALKILDALDGLTLDNKVDILMGKKDLIGINDIELIDGDEKLMNEMRKFHEKKYGSLLKWNNQYYEPYLLVNSWCIEDLPKEELKDKTSLKFTYDFEPNLIEKINNMFAGNRLLGNPHSRSLHYAQYQSDVAYTVQAKDYQNLKIENGVMLFKEFKEQIPFWVNEYIKDHPQKSIESAVKNKKYIVKTGAKSLYDDQVKFDTNPIEIKNPFIKGNDNLIDLSEEDEEKALQDLVKRIQDYADNDKIYGWKHFENENGLTLKVPGRAFMHYALGRCSKTSDSIGFDSEEVNLPKYSPFSKSGLKMTGDDVFHTDSWLGAGLNIKQAYDYDDEYYKLFMDAVWEMQYSLEKREFFIINRGNKNIIEGIAVNVNNYESVDKGKRILVIPNLSVDFEQAFFQCDHIICENGGKLAHLATLAREFDKSIIRVENATLQYIRKLPLTIDFENNIIKYEMKNENNKKLKL